MILKLKYFGMIAEAIGKEEESFDFSENTVEDLNQNLKNKYSKLDDLNYNFAVNQNMVEETELLNEDDEIALWMGPQNVNNGWIKGVFPAITVAQGSF